MIFRQLFDRDSCTYTYLLADEVTREAILVDPVRELVDRDLQLLDELGLTLRHCIETHVHADHITAAGTLRQRVGCESVLSARAGADCADVNVSQGDAIEVGSIRVEVRETPGHTNTCVSYYVPSEGMIFTGDALLIRGCGRTDFQQGDAATLYASVHEQVFSLPDDTRIFPAHDYKGRTMTTVAEEKAHNPRLGGGNTVEQFVEIMGNLNLSQPKKIGIAVPANQQCGLPVQGKVSGWAPIVRNEDGVPEVPVSWVAANTDAGRIIDVREPDEWSGPLGHIEGAELVPLATVGRAAADWDPTAPIITVCRSGGRSGNAARILESMGFQRVASMEGGMTAWDDSSLPRASNAGTPAERSE